VGARETTRRRTSTIQVSPSLNLMITKFATEQNITKAEAADRIFNVLYPKGMGSEADASLAPPQETGDSTPEPGTELDLEQKEGEEDISDELNKTVKDLRTVQTIRALTSNLNGKGNDDSRITTKDALELKKIEAMFGPKGGATAGTDVLDATFRKYVEPLQEQVKMLEAKISDTRVADAEKRAAAAEDKLKEREAQDARQTEIQAFLGPVNESITKLNDQIMTLGERIEAGKEPPQSEELKAINSLATEMRNLVQKLGQTGSGGEGKEGLADTIDQLTLFLDKLQGIQGKLRGGGEGEFDWRAAALTTIGEVTTEALHTFRDIQSPPLGSEEEAKEGGEGKKEELSNQVVLRRVYNYAVKKIGEGQLQLNPYDAAKELNLTPNQVWWAVEELRKKGLLKAGKPPSGSREEGDVESGREPAGFTELPPGVEA